jgi:hypothetical protein
VAHFVRQRGAQARLTVEHLQQTQAAAAAQQTSSDVARGTPAWYVVDWAAVFLVPPAAQARASPCWP